MVSIMAKAYYNENDPFAANWLRNLIDAGLIMPGDVDERSIVDVQPSDLDGYDRCHFFAGIGGWELALQYAGWTGPVWTGSCPCQPFSSAGKGKGTADERHLWPEFARLIRECKPPTVFGEQVASKAGRGWLDGVFTDLEGMGYAAAGADLCAAGIGAPHIRQRLFWVADAEDSGWRSSGVCCNEDEAYRANEDRGANASWLSGDAGHCGADCSGLADAEGCNGRLSVREGQGEVLESVRGREACSGLGDTNGGRRQQVGHGITASDREAIRGWQASGHSGSSPWSDFDLVRCVEPTKEPGRYVEKWRRVESGLVPLAARVSGRVVVSRAGVQTGAEVQEETREVSAAGLLKGYGNSIVPELTAEFITAYMEAQDG